MSHLNSKFLTLCSHLTPSYCQSHRKLILVCDMDETLITEARNGDKVILRPKICYILKSLRHFYELCLVTYSTRERTQSIIEKYLDPDSKFFGNRILCREDIIPHFKNKLDAFLAHLPKSFGKSPMTPREVVGNVHFRSSVIRHPVSRGFTTIRTRRPPVWIYIVALDDFPLAWSNLATCIPIRPFLPNRFSRNRQATSEINYVLSLQRFLIKLHSAVFRDQRTSSYRNKTPELKAVTETSRSKCRSAYSVITRIRRRPSQVHRFQALCHSDPGKLIDFGGKSEHLSHYARGENQRRASGTSKGTPTCSLPMTPSNGNDGYPNRSYRMVESGNLTTSCPPYARKSTQSDTGDVTLCGPDNNDRVPTSCMPSRQPIRHVYRPARFIPQSNVRNNLVR